MVIDIFLRVETPHVHLRVGSPRGHAVSEAQGIVAQHIQDRRRLSRRLSGVADHHDFAVRGDRSQHTGREQGIDVHTHRSGDMPLRISHHITDADDVRIIVRIIILQYVG